MDGTNLAVVALFGSTIPSKCSDPVSFYYKNCNVDQLLTPGGRL